MAANSSPSNIDQRKLKRDFLNDINLLKMNLQALELAREDPGEFQGLVDLMSGAIDTVEQRIKETLTLIASASAQS